MKTVKLTKGYSAVVDDIDFDRVNALKWYATIGRSGNVYAVRKTAQSYISMHCFILGIEKGADHRDGDGLNNQRSNLRRASSLQNNRNRRKRKSGSSRFKGVSWHKQDRLWRVRIKVRGKEILIGLFEDEILAALQYDKVARKLFGRFAHLNNPQNQ